MHIDHAAISYLALSPVTVHTPIELLRHLPMKIAARWGRCPPTTTFSYGQRSERADLSELLLSSDNITIIIDHAAAKQCFPFMLRHLPNRQYPVPLSFRAVRFYVGSPRLNGGSDMKQQQEISCFQLQPLWSDQWYQPPVDTVRTAMSFR